MKIGFFFIFYFRKKIEKLQGKNWKKSPLTFKKEIKFENKL